MLAAATIGNATLIAYDDNPVLVTDPWLGDENPAYFGSWGLSHRIPPEIRKDMMETEYVYCSHGHPDHLDGPSLENFKGKKILLADHVGRRIQKDLQDEGYDVQVLPDREWVQLSPRVKVFTITTWIQDSVILVDVGGRLFVNLNDAGDTHCRLLLRKIIKQYEHSYLMALCACHDVDMINFWTEDGTFVLPPALDRDAPGARLSSIAKTLGATSVIPFSSFHSYQRADSIWAREYTRGHDEYLIGFDHSAVEFIPAFSRIDCETGDHTPINPPTADDIVRPPEDFGDNWSDELTAEDVRKIETYFRQRQTVRDNFGFVNFRVGGRDNEIRLEGEERQRGLTFEAPRHSLMTAIEYEVFDDLLIGNFMKTTMHNVDSLYDHGFNYAVTKWGDNGRAFSHGELEEYMKVYKQRAGRDWLFTRFYLNPINELAATSKKYIPAEGPVYNAARKIFRMLN